MGFMPELWADKTLNEVLNALKTQQRIVNTITDYTPYVLGKNTSAYHGPKLGVGVAVDLPASAMSSANAQTVYNLTFDQKKGVLFNVSDIDQAQASVDMLKAQSEDAGLTLLDAYDLYIMQTMIDGLANGNKKTIANTTDNKLSLEDIRAARKILNTAKAPLKYRTCALHPDMEDDLYDIDGFISRDKIHDTVALRDGVVGRILGFDVILCADMPKVTSAFARSTGTLAVALFYASYSTGFGRQKGIQATSVTNVLTPGTDVNIYTVFGASVQDNSMIVGYRKATA